jgi:hypothetical protein
LLKSWTCSFNRLQSPLFLHIVTIATSNLEVEGKSEAWRVCFSSGRRRSIACCALPFYKQILSATSYITLHGAEIIPLQASPLLGWPCRLRE